MECDHEYIDVEHDQLVEDRFLDVLKLLKETNLLIFKASENKI